MILNLSSWTRKNPDTNIQHMIKKWNPSITVSNSWTIQVQLNGHIGFFSDPMDLSNSSWN